MHKKDAHDRKILVLPSNYSEVKEMVSIIGRLKGLTSFYVIHFCVLPEPSELNQFCNYKYYIDGSPY